MIIGIDLGTTNSSMAYVDENGVAQIIANKDGERTTPSVIMFEGDTPIVGTYAKDNSATDPLNVAQFIKRQIGDINFKFPKEDGTELTCEELSAIILKKLKEDAEEALGKKVTKAVITVPAYFDDAQRNATKDAGEIAGLEVLKVINEPTAAALAYGMGRKDEDLNIMVYDLGGGTFDVTIMNLNDKEITVKATGGDKNLGGFDFDNVIMNHIIKQFNEKFDIDLYDDEDAMQELREKAEVCKKALSNRAKTRINLTSQGEKLVEELTKEQFEQWIDQLLDRTSFIMEDVLDSASMEWKDIDKILLVGGSTRINRVQEIIENITGKKPSSEVNPDEVVAIGAAYQAEILSDKDDSIIDKKIVDVNSHSLGTLSINTDTDKLQNFIILPKNTPIPAEKSSVFYSMVDSQKEMKIDITEGEDDDPQWVRVIGSSVIKLNDRPAGSPVKIVIGYDENSIIHASAIDEINNEKLGDMNIYRTSNLTDLEVKEKQNKMSITTIE